MRFLPAVLAVLFTSPAFADDKPKPNTLTPKEIADGWVLLFDGETTFGWKIEGEAKVKDGVLHIGGPKATTATLTTAFGPSEFRMDTGGGAGQVTFQCDGSSCSFGLPNQRRHLRMTYRIEGTGSALSQSTTVGPDLSVVIDVDATTNNPARMRIDVPAGGTVTISSAKVKPVGTKPLFNGKDLSGWKVFDDPKRSATKFLVTKDGELSAKNGPGDLQTEKAFDNFVLQLECKTNGKWLNSGVFFRCIPNQYQNGYECQIQNAFTGEDRAKPIDFGTGAIYRRIAARKVVSNDNEWFTLTIVADGKHFATWVNGYQTVDWTDDRPANDNPRQGYRAEKGHISIQGHDPTTDLLFRNIRIVELPATK